MKDNGDLVLWNNFRKGDEQALATIFNDHYDPLYFYGLKIVADQAIVEDCVQELFLKLWRNRENLGETKIIRPYLLKALRRHLIDHLATQKKQTSSDDEFSDIVFSHEDFLIKNQGNSQQQRLLSQAMNNLPKRQKEAIYLKFYDGLSYDEISEVMAMNPQSVRNQVHRAVKGLRQSLKGNTIIDLTLLVLLFYPLILR